MRRAVAISAVAHREASLAARSGMNEHEIEAAIDFAFRRLGGMGPAYASILASGPKRFATSSIAQTDVPPDPPASSPSSRASRLAMMKESRSDTRTHSSTTSLAIAAATVIIVPERKIVQVDDLEL